MQFYVTNTMYVTSNVQDAVQTYIKKVKKY